MQNIDAAQHWVGQGIAVIPCGYKSKRPDKNALSQVGSVDKNGRAMWKTYTERLPTEAELKVWFNSKWRNVAVVTGWQKLCVLDFDCLNRYQEWIMWAKSVGGQALAAIETFRVLTGRPGIHNYLFILNPPERTMSMAGLDIKASGYCLTSPSLHPAGYRYTPIQGKITTVDSIKNILPQEWIEQAKVYAAPSQVAPVMPKSLSPFDIVPDRPSALIKSRVRIIDFFPDAKPTSGGYYEAHCPFHDDNRTSFWINDKTNRCRCRTGTCIQGSEDVIGFYARLKNISSSQAISELIKRC